jgi:sec-independent protein translocase protein TatA
VRLGWLEILVLLGVILLFFGPKRLPGLGNALGSAIRGFKRGISGHNDDPVAGKPALPPSNPESQPSDRV